jgi:LCP family protein required for cell wall assembly
VRNTLLALAVAVVALYLVVCLPIDRAISFTRDERAGLRQELSWHVPGLPYYVLALGSDAREGETVSRSDTMILVRVDPLGGKITMLSIPRDTMVEIDGYGTQKINAAYAFGGVAGAVHEVHELTGAPISQAAVIRFDGMESLVDYLGGVTVNVPVPVYDPEYTGLILDAGEQQMDGHTALLFSRVRHGFDLGDYQRQKDQRILIEAIMRKALGLAPWKLPGVVGHMDGMLGTSMRMYSLLPLMLRLKVGGATIYQATVPSTTAMVDGISYVVADEEALAQMMDVIDAGGDPAALM